MAFDVLKILMPWSDSGWSQLKTTVSAISNVVIFEFKNRSRFRDQTTILINEKVFESAKGKIEAGLVSKTASLKSKNVEEPAPDSFNDFIELGQVSSRYSNRPD